jgi:hypothetical protein
VYERGAYEPVAAHATEAEACAHLRSLLGDPGGTAFRP